MTFLFNKFAVVTGSILLGVSALLLLDRSKGEKATDRDIKQLAEKLKHAWAGNHNP